MSGRIVFPIHNVAGQLVAYAGRAIDAMEPRWKFPEGFQKGLELFNLHRVDSAHVHVVESFWGVLALDRASIPNAVAQMGRSMSEPQEKLLQRFEHVGGVSTPRTAASRSAGNPPQTIPDDVVDYTPSRAVRTAVQTCDPRGDRRILGEGSHTIRLEANCWTEWLVVANAFEWSVADAFELEFPNARRLSRVGAGSRFWITGEMLRLRGNRETTVTVRRRQ